MDTYTISSTEIQAALDNCAIASDVWCNDILTRAGQTKRGFLLRQVRATLAVAVLKAKEYESGSGSLLAVYDEIITLPSPSELVACWTFRKNQKYSPQTMSAERRRFWLAYDKVMAVKPWARIATAAARLYYPDDYAPVPPLQ